MKNLTQRGLWGSLLSVPLLCLQPALALASEADLILPEFATNHYTLLVYGIVICVLGMVFGYYQFAKVTRLKAHRAMLDVANIIYETCKTYLIQQGKLLFILFLFIAFCIAFYFGYLGQMPLGSVLIILGWTIIGILGS